jgi:Luciferase-like monooxygenase
MRIGYMIDTYSPLGDREAVASSMEAMIEEAQLAERAGFHSVVVPDRHRAPECRFAGPEQLLTVLARETDRVGIGSYTFVGTLSHPMRSAEQFSVIDNLARGRLFTTVSRGFLPEFLGAVRHSPGAHAGQTPGGPEDLAGERFSFEGPRRGDAGAGCFGCNDRGRAVGLSPTHSVNLRQSPRR